MKKNSLNYQILKYILLFVFGIMGLLWLFQIKLLQPYYEYQRENTLKTVAENVSLMEKSNYLNDFLANQAARYDVCIRVIKNNDVYNANSQGCVIHNLSIDKLFEYYELAKPNGNYLLETELIEMSFDADKPNTIYPTNNGDKNLTYLKLNSSSDTLIIVNTRVNKINTTTDILSQQLLIISLVIIIFAIILTFILAFKIARPIIQITNEAKKLHKGKYKRLNMQDYEEVENLDRTLCQACKNINQADKAKRDLIANVSHDLRTPLTMISGYGELMRDFTEERNMDNIEIIIDESKRLNLFVEDLLLLSKFEESNIELNYQIFDLSKLINTILKKYKKTFKDEGFKVDLKLNKKIHVEADELRINQVIENIINNAIHYSDKDKYLQIKTTIKNNNVLLEITDHGKGIAPEDLKNIFDRYYKVDKKHLRNEKSSGIGLSIVKEILELHHVEYGVKSDLNKGTTFYFELPIKKSKTISILK